MKNEKIPAVTQEEFIYISRQFANMFGFPVRLYNENELIFFHSTTDLITDPVSLCFDEIIKKSEEVSYYVYDNIFYYGIINCRTAEICNRSGKRIKADRLRTKKSCISAQH